MRVQAAVALDHLAADRDEDVLQGDARQPASRPLRITITITIIFTTTTTTTIITTITSITVTLTTVTIKGFSHARLPRGPRKSTSRSLPLAARKSVSNKIPIFYYRKGVPP